MWCWKCQSELPPTGAVAYCTACRRWIDAATGRFQAVQAPPLSPAPTGALTLGEAEGLEAFLEQGVRAILPHLADWPAEALYTLLMMEQGGAGRETVLAAIRHRLAAGEKG